MVIIENLWRHYQMDYLMLHDKKISFFKQHTLWKYRKELIKLFDFPETIRNWRSFEFNLSMLEIWIKENKE